MLLLAGAATATTNSSTWSSCSVHASDPEAFPASRCPSNAKCQELDLECLDCRCPTDCKYGAKVKARCTAREGVPCQGEEKEFDVGFTCQFCFQMSREDYDCRAR